MVGTHFTSHFPSARTKQEAAQDPPQDSVQRPGGTGTGERHQHQLFPPSGEATEEQEGWGYQPTLAGLQASHYQKG